ncbi:MAG: hypothetical protein KJ970_10670 [Candidatus Eisenbacteria bacterium]|uniref:Uncharacterized protein n=1 Tax=Eiseniibacteriota bacterium TaxID=2212470 RepID=A0A948RYE5_UNCEI|nr:hypothetical protein [Candidatus Eisenbacteria bacterium]MBU2691377.1 hypothetical protein [Candidatus Eisenbacteria bacterium]
MPILPQQNILVNTGGALNAQSYSAANSPQALVGTGNEAEYITSIAHSFNEQQKQIQNIDILTEQLEKESPNDELLEAIRYLKNLKEEIQEAKTPDHGRMKKWLEGIKQTIQASSLGIETIQAAEALFKQFGF